MAKPIVLIAEELSPATVEALGPDLDVRTVDGTDRAALLAALPDRARHPRPTSYGGGFAPGGGMVSGAGPRRQSILAIGIGG